jgi:hypothetical protein
MDRHMLRIEGHLATSSVLTDMEKLYPPRLQCSGASQGIFKSSCSTICDSSVFHRKKVLEDVSHTAESCLPGVGYGSILPTFCKLSPVLISLPGLRALSAIP